MDQNKQIEFVDTALVLPSPTFIQETRKHKAMFKVAHFFFFFFFLLIITVSFSLPFFNDSVANASAALSVSISVSVEFF